VLIGCIRSMKNLSGASLFTTRHWAMVSPVDQPDAKFVCARWVPLAPNGNFKRLVSESGQCVEIRMKGVVAIFALGAINGVCSRPWHMLTTLGT
jgi:hypothetical protein